MTNKTIKAIDAMQEAQKIAFAPFLFQATVSLRKLGVLDLIFDRRVIGGINLEDMDLISGAVKVRVVPDSYEMKYSVDFYEDVGGQYFPYMNDKDRKYVQREDGKVELMQFSPKGSKGKIIRSHRKKVSKKK